jgi:hypothetical protein
MGPNRPPLEYLVSSSNNSLESFELGRLNQTANLRKEMRQIVDEWVESEVESRIARWILESRRAENADAISEIAASIEPVRGRQLALTFASHFLEGASAAESSDRQIVPRKLPSLAASNHPARDSAGSDEAAMRVAPPAEIALPPLPPQSDDGSETLSKVRLSAASQAVRHAADRENVHPSFQFCGNPGADAAENLRSLFDADSKKNLVHAQRQHGERSPHSDSAASLAPRNRKRTRDRKSSAQRHRAGTEPPSDFVSHWPLLETRLGQRIRAPLLPAIFCGGALAPA